MIAADSVGGDTEKYEKYSKVVVFFFPQCPIKHIQISQLFKALWSKLVNIVAPYNLTRIIIESISPKRPKISPCVFALLLGCKNSEQRLIKTN